MKIEKKDLEKLYEKYNSREFVNPDPLQFLYDYPDPEDREIVALIASSLAYGRVGRILLSLEKIFEIIGPLPKRYIQDSSLSKTRKSLSEFKHRWTTGDDIAGLVAGIKKMIVRYGSLEKGFSRFYRSTDENIIPALEGATAELRKEGAGMIASPAKGSACKKLNLFLRWMVRKDDVDPGGWKNVSTSKLLVPLDTHMHKIGNAFGMINGKQANMKTAVKMTKAFSKIAPGDPVKYDFALTRLGIRGELDLDKWLNEIRER